MADRFTARMSDGTDSRAGWIFWLVGAFLAAAIVLTFAKFVVIAVFYFSGLGGSIPDSAYTFLEAFLETVLFAAALVGLSSFATRRMLMPRAAWIAVALAPMIGAVGAIRDALTGYYAPLLYVALLLAGVAIAWALDSRRRLPEQALPADGVSSDQ